MTRTGDPEVLTIITRMNVGGPARLVTMLAADIVESGHVVLAGEPAVREGSLEDGAAEAGVQVLRVPGLRRAISPLNDLRALFWLYRYMRRTRPRIVATHMAKAGLLGRLAAVAAGVPIRIHTFHGHVLEGYFGPSVSRSIRWAERLMAGLSTRLIAISPEVATELKRMRIGGDRITVIRVGVKIGLPQPGRLREELRCDPDEPLVGFVGRLTPVKAPDLFLEVAARIHATRPRVRFVVVGDGDLWAELHLLARRLGLESAVFFAGWRQNLEGILPDLDVLVCCSHNEGTPLAVIEAAAMGVPAVATRVGGTPDIIRDGVSGFLVERGDVTALAASVESLIDDRGRRLAMGAAARSGYLERYAGDRMVGETRDLYRLYLEPPGR